MIGTPRQLVPTLVLALGAAGCAGAGYEQALPSWNEGPARDAIVDFVERVGGRGADHVDPPERIAVFDNDGTLWGEQPAYFQLLFAVDRVKALADQHPEWRTEQPFQAVLEGDLAKAAESGKEGLMKLLLATHAGMTGDEFSDQVREWLTTARHPETGRPFTEMVYQPMLELLDYLRANGFRTFIVSGGGIDFLRVFAEQVYGIPPEQVVGTSLASAYELRDGRPVVTKLPEVDFVNDGPGKPLGIDRYIGRRPIAAFGNSDGDFQMLEWTTSGHGPRLGVIVHHDDAEREHAYDRGSHIGGLERGLDEAAARGWILVSMRKDWKRVYPPRR